MACSCKSPERIYNYGIYIYIYIYIYTYIYIHIYIYVLIFFRGNCQERDHHLKRPLNPKPLKSFYTGFSPDRWMVGVGAGRHAAAAGSVALQYRVVVGFRVSGLAFMAGSSLGCTISLRPRIITNNPPHLLLINVPKRYHYIIAGRLFVVRRCRSL